MKIERERANENVTWQTFFRVEIKLCIFDVKNRSTIFDTKEACHIAFLKLTGKASLHTQFTVSCNIGVEAVHV